MEDRLMDLLEAMVEESQDTSITTPVGDTKSWDVEEWEA